MINGRRALTEIKNMFLNDEMLCRLVCLGENPFDDNKILPTQKEIEDKVFNYQPIDDAVNKENNVVLNFYTGFEKIPGNAIQTVMTYEIIGIMMFVPLSLNKKDMRVYDLEDKIRALLDGYTLKDTINSLSYIEGKFVALPSVTGYAQFNMQFQVIDSKSAKYGRY